jgi:FixJ family two-component response regulator
LRTGVKKEGAGLPRETEHRLDLQARQDQFAAGAAADLKGGDVEWYRIHSSWPATILTTWKFLFISCVTMWQPGSPNHQFPVSGDDPMPALTVVADDPLVLVVDDDEDVRHSLQELMESVGLEVACFASPRELLNEALPDRPGCLVLDVRMPGASGLDLQHQLATRGIAKPIVFLTGYGDIPMTVQAMKAGAVDFLTKPVRDQTLLDAVIAGIQRDVEQRAQAENIYQHAARFATLTPRERQVLFEVARGRVNKQIAFELGISEVTVKLHRSNVMRKMGTVSVGELIRAWDSLPSSLRETRQA